MKSLYTIYSQRLAGYLMTNGFPLLRLAENEKTNRNNFIFANTELLQDYIDRWKIEKLQNNKEEF